MPIACEVRPADDLTVFVVSGEVDLAQLLEALQAFYGGAPTSLVLWDMRAVSGARLSAEEIRQLAGFVTRQAPKRPGGRTALVAGTALDYGLARMYAALAELRDVPWSIAAFERIEDAEAWLRE